MRFSQYCISVDVPNLTEIIKSLLSSDVADIAGQHLKRLVDFKILRQVLEFLPSGFPAVRQRTLSAAAMD
jgi:hypothetical protein